MKHTPGPWIREGSLVYALNERGRDRMCMNIHVYTSAIDGAEPGEAEANARLIAAAPEMLEALQRFVEVDACDCHTRKNEAGPCAWCQAKAATAKAEGWVNISEAYMHNPGEWPRKC